MSQNKNEELLFDRWLTENLKSMPAADSAFAQNLSRQMQRLHALKMLRRTLLQKRIAAAAFIITLASIIGLLCCPPVLRRVYALLETIFTGALSACIHPQSAHLAALAGALVILLFLFKAAWKALDADI